MDIKEAKESSEFHSLHSSEHTAKKRRVLIIPFKKLEVILFWMTGTYCKTSWWLWFKVPSTLATSSIIMGKRYLLVGLDSRLADRYRLPFRIHWMGPRVVSCWEVWHHTGRKGDGVVHHWSAQQRTQPSLQMLSSCFQFTDQRHTSGHTVAFKLVCAEFTKLLNFFHSVVFSPRRL